MILNHDPLRLIGRRVVVESDGTTIEGTMCAAGLGGIVMNVDGATTLVEPADVASVTPVDSAGVFETAASAA